MSMQRICHQTRVGHLLLLLLLGLFPGMVVAQSPVNQAPTANDQAVTVKEDASIAITLTGKDPEGSKLIFAIATQPQHGTVTLSGAKATYKPAVRFHAVDTFTFTVSDGKLVSAPATVTITVQHVNHAPKATAQKMTTPENQPATIPLAMTDVDDGDALSIVVTKQPAHGTLSTLEQGAVTYTPAPYYAKTDSFSYKAFDGTVYSSVVTVSITISPINYPPTANSQKITMNEDATAAILLSGSDPDSDKLTYTIVTPPASGKWKISGNKVNYTPNPRFHAADSFTFTVSDGKLTSDPATVSINVQHVNHVPTASAQKITTAENQPSAITLAMADVDDEDTLSISVTKQPLHGTLSALDHGVVTYTPAAYYAGTDSFSYKAFDGTAYSKEVVVSFTITAVNYPPTAAGQTVAVTPNTATSILLNGSDPDGDKLTFTVIDKPAHGTVSVSGAKAVYTPAKDYVGPDQFTYTVSDGKLTSAVATVTITVGNLTGRWDAIHTSGNNIGCIGLLLTQQDATTVSGTCRGIAFTGQLTGQHLTFTLAIPDGNVVCDLTWSGEQLSGTATQGTNVMPFTFVRKSTNPVSPYSGRPTVTSASITWNAATAQYVVSATWDRPVCGWDLHITQDGMEISGDNVDVENMAYDPSTYTFTMPLLKTAPLHFGACTLALDEGDHVDWVDPYGVPAWDTTDNAYTTTITILGEQLNFADYWPLTIGNRWDTAHTDGTNTESQTVDAQTTIGTQQAMKLKNQGPDWVSYNYFGYTAGNFNYFGWDEDSNTTRLSPPMAFPTSMTLGQSMVCTGNWLKNGANLGAYTFTITIEGKATVTVPAGTFTDCLVLKLDQQTPDGTQQQRQWFAKGVGQVKSVDLLSGDTRVLTYAAVDGHTYGALAPSLIGRWDAVGTTPSDSQDDICGVLGLLITQQTLTNIAGTIRGYAFNGTINGNQLTIPFIVNGMNATTNLTSNGTQLAGTLTNPKGTVYHVTFSRQSTNPVSPYTGKPTVTSSRIFWDATLNEYVVSVQWNRPIIGWDCRIQQDANEYSSFDKAHFSYDPTTCTYNMALDQSVPLNPGSCTITLEDGSIEWSDPYGAWAWDTTANAYTATLTVPPSNTTPTLTGCWESTTTSGGGSGVFGVIMTQTDANTLAIGGGTSGQVNGNHVTFSKNILGVTFSFDCTWNGDVLEGTLSLQGNSAPITFHRVSTNPVTPYTGRPTVVSSNIYWDVMLGEYVLSVTWDRPTVGWDFYLTQGSVQLSGDAIADRAHFSYDPATFTRYFTLLPSTPLTAGPCTLTLDKGIVDWYDPYGVTAWDTTANAYTTTLTVPSNSVEQINFAEYWPLTIGNQWNNANADGTDPSSQSVDSQVTIGTQQAMKLKNQGSGWVSYDYFGFDADHFHYFGWDEESTTRLDPPLAFPVLMTIGQPMLCSGDWLVNGVNLGTYTFTGIIEGKETVTVPAGTFTDCVILRIDQTVPGEGTRQQRMWFAKGVGQVKGVDVASGDTRVLTSATVDGHIYDGKTLTGRWEATHTSGDVSGVAGLLITQLDANTITVGGGVTGLVNGSHVTFSQASGSDSLDYDLTWDGGNVLDGTISLGTNVIPFTFHRISTDPVSPYTGKPTVVSSSIYWDTVLHEYVLSVEWDRPTISWDFYLTQGSVQLSGDIIADRAHFTYNPATFTRTFSLLPSTPLAAGPCTLILDKGGVDWYDPYGVPAWDTTASAYTTTLMVPPNAQQEDGPIRALYASMKAAIEAHNVNDFMALVAPDYLNNGEDRNTFQQGLAEGIAAIQTVDLAISGIAVYGETATVTGTFTITYNDGSPSSSFSVPGTEQTGDHSGLGWIAKRNGQWQLFGNQHRAHAEIYSAVDVSMGIYCMMRMRVYCPQATSVTVSGPNTTSKPLSWDANANSYLVDIVPTNMPAVGDQYTFVITYPDQTQEMITGAVTGLVTANPSFTRTPGPNNTLTFQWNNVSAQVPNMRGYKLFVADANGRPIWESANLAPNRTSASFNEDGQATALLQSNTKYECVINVCDDFGNFLSCSNDIVMP